MHTIGCCNQMVEQIDPLGVCIPNIVGPVRLVGRCVLLEVVHRMLHLKVGP